jgi:hypothetical protein
MLTKTADNIQNGSPPHSILEQTTSNPTKHGLDARSRSPKMENDDTACQNRGVRQTPATGTKRKRNDPRHTMSTVATHLVGN